MAFTIPEAITDLPALLNLVNKIASGVSGLPQPPAPISAKAYATLVASLLPDLGDLIDTIRKQAAD
jgi:hypothetical protein